MLGNYILILSSIIMKFTTCRVANAHFFYSIWIWWRISHFPFDANVLLYLRVDTVIPIHTLATIWASRFLFPFVWFLDLNCFFYYCWSLESNEIRWKYDQIWIEKRQYFMWSKSLSPSIPWLSWLSPPLPLSTTYSILIFHMFGKQ